VVSSPRERPMPSHAYVSANMSPFCGYRGVLMRASDSGVDPGVPIDVVIELGKGHDLGFQPRPSPIGRPPAESLLRGLLRPVALGQIPPGRSRASTQQITFITCW
jgi:hypothetical protein